MVVDNTEVFLDEDLDISFVDDDEVVDNPSEEQNASAAENEEVTGKSSDANEPAEDNVDVTKPGKEKPESETEDTTDTGDVEEGETVKEPEEWKPLSEEEQKELYEKAKKLEKEVTEKKKVIDRQGNELGDDRKYRRKMVELAVPEITEEEKEELERISYDEGVVAFQDAYNKLIGEKKEQAIKKEQEEFDRNYKSNMAAINEKIPDYNDLKEDVFNVLVEDGYDEEIARAVADDPGTEDPFVISQIAKRAKIRKEYTSEKSELQKLREENEKLRDGIKSGRKNFLEELDRATKTKGPIRNSVNRQKLSQSKPSNDNLKAEEMDYEDLDINYVEDED